MRILWVSNAPWTGTGYGVQTKNAIWRIAALGHEVKCICYYGLRGASLEINGIEMLPGGADDFGNDVLIPDYQYHNMDMVITHNDAWVMEPDMVRKVRWFPYMPIDSAPPAPEVLARLEHAVRPIAFSKFGVQQLEKHGFNPYYVPHSVDTSVFYPMEQAAARDHHGLPADAFIVGIVGANKDLPSRKSFFEQIQAFGHFQRYHPDALLLVHTWWKGHEDIDRAIELAGIPKTAVIEPDQYKIYRHRVSQDDMRVLYSTMDVLMNCARAGGFEVCQIEAQACGVPVITTDYAAMPENVFAGWTVGYDSQLFRQNTVWSNPNIHEMVARLEEAYQARGDTILREKARLSMVEHYDADMVAELYWKPVLAEIEAHLHDPVEREIGSIKLWVRPGTWDENIAHEVRRAYFPDLIDYRRVQTAVDVGAHIGSFTRRLKAWNPAAQIASIEANPDNAKVLRKNTEGMNGIRVYEARLGYQAGEMVMLSWEYNSGGHAIVPKVRLDDVLNHPVHVPDESIQPFEGASITLDAVLAENQFDQVDVLKLDCEGSEFDILLNAPLDTLQRCEWIVGEAHYEHGDMQAVIDRLAPAFEVVVHKPYGAGDVLGLFCFRRNAA